MNLEQIGENAKRASFVLSGLSTSEKNNYLHKVANNLLKHKADILVANQQDINNFSGNASLVDRLSLTEQRIEEIAKGVLEIAGLPDPIGEFIDEFVRPNGLKIIKVRVPLGVIGIIYEARPNVTVDTTALCLKSGNAVVLRGGKEAINSNKKLVEIMQEVLPEKAVQLITDTSHETADKFMKLQYLDVLIPRGGAGLIKAVKEKATVPIIETGTGNCHIYVDKMADLDMAEKIIINAKCSRPSVCNACEKVLIHKDISKVFLPRIIKVLENNGVEIKQENVDWHEEYLDLKIAIKIVDNVNEAIEHINKYSSKHSESIITQDKTAADLFTSKIDSAAVYVNASTRFTDGGEFGFGAELGISTQKLHARGPVGLRELTSYKYIITGEGQIR